jgi:hypothetical protein
VSPAVLEALVHSGTLPTNIVLVAYDVPAAPAPLPARPTQYMSAHIVIATRV